MKPKKIRVGDLFKVFLYLEQINEILKSTVIALMEKKGKINDRKSDFNSLKRSIKSSGLSNILLPFTEKIIQDFQKALSSKDYQSIYAICWGDLMQYRSKIHQILSTDQTEIEIDHRWEIGIIR